MYVNAFKGVRTKSMTAEYEDLNQPIKLIHFFFFYVYILNQTNQTRTLYPNITKPII